MLRRPPRSTRTDTLLPYTTLFRSGGFLFQALPGAVAGPDFPQAAMDSVMPGWGAGFVAFAVLFFVFTTLVTYYYMAERSEEHTSELQSLMRISYAVFCLNKKTSCYSCVQRPA